MKRILPMLSGMIMKGLMTAFFAFFLFSFTGTRMYASNPPDEGMWLPILIERLNYVDMEKMGLHLTEQELYDINHSSLKDAIVGLSGGGAAAGGFFCTAEVVSGEGLLFTNHHCGYNAVQSHSTPEHDYLTDGFWAMTKGEELSNENVCASFLVRMENVTDSVIPFLSDTLKESARSDKIKELTAKMKKRASENGKYEVSVKAFYGGNEYYLFVFLTYKDVRLVGAPPSSIGKFGGDTDNWMWPRHTGDFTVFRIYTDSTGKPASYNKNNIPLKPKFHLPISMKGVKKDDFAMIWGYPGTTNRYMTSFGIDYAVNTVYPSIIKIFGKRLEVMKERMDVDKKVNIDYAGTYAGIANTWKNFIGQTKMLVKNKVGDKKKSIEADFTSWYGKSPELTKKYGAVLSDLQKNYSQMKKIAVPFFYATMAGSGLDVVQFAGSFGSLKSALEKKNKSGIKDAAEALKKSTKDHFKKIDPAISRKTLSEGLKLYSQNVAKDQLPSVFALIEKDYNNDFNAFADAVFNTSIFASEGKAMEFLDKPSLKVMNKDLGSVMAQSFQDAGGKYMTSMGEARSAVTAGNRHFIAGLREMDPKLVRYPDANSTLRMSYGKVLDYYPADAVHYEYYTTLSGVMQKEDPNNEEFIVPAKLKELYRTKDFGPYAENGDIVTCFLTNNDITGGNSGSPVINGNGELIGLAFDGNWEAMSGDISFEPDLQRTINVDIRYVLFIIDKYAGATNLIKELTLVK
ncbi:MAG: S46 family peptidase [Bacteroidetes bacterium]|nr:S46 family peptidase [Bacteroidota bacterium]